MNNHMQKYRNRRTGGVGYLTAGQAASSAADLELVDDDAKPYVPELFKPKPRKEKVDGSAVESIAADSPVTETKED